MTSEFERHIACDECGSSDGNSLYTDGHSFCFVCHTWKSGDNTNHTTTTTYVQRMEQRGFPQRLSRRGISERICEEYGITVDGDVLCFHYRDSDNRIIGIKTKSKDKQFRYDGETDGRFFGQNLFRNNGGKRIVICEGELDAATCREAFPAWESVSLPHGAASAKKAMQHNYEWLSTWEEVVLFFDNDSAGKKATQEAAGVLPPGKVKIADLKTYKDPSEAAQDDNLEAVRQAIWNAEQYKPDGIIDGKTLLSLVIEPQQDCIHEYPFAGLQEKLQGVRSGELVTITSGTGQGKSSLCRELAAHFLSKGERVGYVALEESNR